MAQDLYSYHECEQTYSCYEYKYVYMKCVLENYSSTSTEYFTTLVISFSPSFIYSFLNRI